MKKSNALDRQRTVYLDGAFGYRQAIPFVYAELERLARQKLSPEAWAYIAGSAGLEQTARSNESDFQYWKIVPRMLRNVEERDLSTQFFGHTLPAPFFLAPIGALEMAHPEADLAIARACGALGIPYIFSNQASVPMEECAVSMGETPRMFQLYWSRSDELAVSLLRRAETCGCSAIVVTLDTTMLGWRTRDLDLGYLPFLKGIGIAQYTSDPVFCRLLEEPLEAPSGNRRPSFDAIRTLISSAQKYPGSFWSNLRSGIGRKAVQKFTQIYSRPNITWTDLPFLRKHTRLPIILKGILHPEDAKKALDYGVDGIYVSNHGGRQVDGAISSIEALPGIVEAVRGKAPVLFDSGVRGGADAFKALALGATAIGIGRPYCYALGIGGQAGVEALLLNWMADLELTMGLSGCKNIAEIHSTTLHRG